MPVSRLLPLLLAVMLLCACSVSTPADGVPAEQGTSPASPAPQQLVLPYVSKASLDPLSTTSRINQELGALLFDPLVELDDSLEPSLVLAESIDVDGLTVTVRLKPGLTFHDGSPLTSQDVLDTLSRIQAGGTNYDARMDGVESIQAADEQTLVLTLLSENSLFASLLEIPILKAGDDSSAPVGSGKFSYDAQNGLLLRNDNWAGGPVALSSIRLVQAPELQEAPLSLGSGELSLMTLFGAKLSLEGVRYVSNNLIFLGVNPSCAALSTPELRRALSCALTRSTLIDDNVASGGFVALSPISSKWYLYDSSAVSRGADAAYTESVLEQAGYLLTEQEVRETSGGRPLSLSLLYNNASSERVALAGSIAAQLSAFGYQVSLVEANPQEYASLVQAGTFDLYLGEIRLTPDMDVAPLVQSGGALNFARFSSPTLDSALQALKSASPEQLQSCATVLIAALDSEMPLIPLYFALGEVALGEPSLRSVLTPTPTNPLSGLEHLSLAP